MTDIDALYNKFQTIFDIKEVAEFKNAMAAEPYTPTQFVQLASTMKRSFIEGYLLAKLEQKRKNIKIAYNMYKEDKVCPVTKNESMNSL